MTARDFAADLRWSHDWSDAKWWLPVYQEAFPTMVGMHTIKPDGWAQRGAVDRILYLRDGTGIKVDEKVREKHRDDILLEIWGDMRRRTPGWAHPDSDLTCDYIAYALAPSSICYLLPYQDVRRVVKVHGDRWFQNCYEHRDGYQLAEATSRYSGRTWKTQSLCIPTGVLLDALRDGLVIRWAHSPSAMPVALGAPIARRVQAPGQLALEAQGGDQATS